MIHCEPDYIDDERGPVYATISRDTETGRWRASYTCYQAVGAPYGDWPDLTVEDRRRVLSEMRAVHEALTKLKGLPSPARELSLQRIAENASTPGLDGDAEDFALAFEQTLIQLGWLDQDGEIH